MIVASSALPEDQVAAMLRGAVMALDPTITLYQTGSLTEQLGLVLLPARIAAIVLGAFGLLAVVLAATGVYGIMAYAVSRRTREIGIRMALGARRGSVLGVVLRRTAILVAIGTSPALVFRSSRDVHFRRFCMGLAPPTRSLMGWRFL